MISDERLKSLMEQVGMPNSRSLKEALMQCDKEARLDASSRLSLTDAEREAIERQLGWIKRMLVAWEDRGAAANGCLRCDEAALTELLERSK
jgi:hypothetical protein